MNQDKTIEQLSVADSLSGSEKFVFAKNGDNGAVTAETIKAFATKGLSPKEALFIDLWNEACGDYGTYNAETGYFELNGLTDITYNEALKIYQVSQPLWNATGFDLSHTYFRCRTLLPIKSAGISDTLSIANDPVIEVIQINTGANYSNVSRGTFTKFNISYSSIRKVLGEVVLVSHSTLNAARCAKLEYIMISGLRKDINFAGSPLLSLESFQYMVANSANTTAITITVHPDVYAKLTNDTTNAAAAALTADELAQWNQVLNDALAKNISFVTV